MPLRNEQSWPREKRKHANSLLEEKDGLVPTKIDDNSNEIAEDKTLSESEQNKKV